jgi:hypothetical protein
VIFLGSHPRGMSLREGASISPSVRDRTATNKRDRQIAEKPPIATGLLVVVIRHGSNRFMISLSSSEESCFLLLFVVFC